MKRTPRATIWLPDLTTTMLERAALHPIQRRGLARWWERSRRSQFTALPAEQADLTWPNRQFEWADMARQLRHQPQLAAVLRNGGTVRIMTMASSIDVIAVILALTAQLPAIAVEAVLVVDRAASLPLWESANVRITTLLNPAVSASLRQEALLHGRGVQLSEPQKIQQYLTAHTDWTALQCAPHSNDAAFTIIDDRVYDWGALKGLYVSELVQYRAPSVWHRVAASPESPPVFVHTHAPSLGAHVLQAEQRQPFDTYNTVVAEAMSASPERLVVIGPSVTDGDWQSYDDAVVYLLTHLRAGGYDVVLVGVPHAHTGSERYPLAYLAATQSHTQPVLDTISLADAREAVWSYMT